MDTLRALYLKLTPELKEIQISPILGACLYHAAAGDVHHEVSVGLVPLPRLLGKGCACARVLASCGVLLNRAARVGFDTKLKTPPYSIAGNNTE